MLGVRQWGQPFFRLADLREDGEILQQAAKEVQRLLARDPALQSYPSLAGELERLAW